MSDGSKIEWTDATWNPIRARRKDTGKVGWHCERVSPACAHCYAAAHNGRMLPGCGTGLDYTRYHRDQVDIFIDEPTLLQPLKWRNARKVFVCSMTDLFGEFVPFELVDRVFAVMALAGRHTFQVLTKRPDRMAEYIDGRAYGRWCEIAREMEDRLSDRTARYPLENVWLGTTVENQEWADKRIPHLMQCPAAVRFVSCEPLLGELSLLSVGSERWDVLHGWKPDSGPDGSNTDRIDWVIAGGESGRGRRRMNLDWPRLLRDECDRSAVAFFMKQIDKVQPIPDDLMVRQFPASVVAAEF